MTELKLGDILRIYRSDGPQRCGIFIGREHYYCRTNPEKYNSVYVIELNERLGKVVLTLYSEFIESGQPHISSWQFNEFHEDWMEFSAGMGRMVERSKEAQFLSIC